jgi:hypothetical protein
MSAPEGYEPVGGWAGQIVAGAPEPAPVVRDVVPAAPAAPRADGSPSFISLVGAFFVADVAIAFFGAFTAFYWLVIAIAGVGTYGWKAGSIVASAVWVLVTIPLTRALIQLLIGWRTDLVVLGATMVVAVFLRIALWHAGLPHPVTLLLVIPLQAAILLAVPGAFARPAQRRR